MTVSSFRRYALVCLGCVGLAWSPDGRAGSTAYLSNFTNAQGSSQGTLATPLGQRFRTGPNADGYILDSAMVRVVYSLGSGAGDMVVKLCSDGGSAPGSVLATLSGAGPTSNAYTNLVFTAPSGTILQKATNYWITVASSGAADFGWRFVAAGSGFDAEDGWAMGTNGNYNTAPNSAYVFFLELAVSPGVKYFQDFSGADVGDTSLGDGSTLSSTSLGSAAQVQDAKFKELQLTTNGGANTRSAFLLPDLDPGRAVNAFSAKWNAEVYGNFPTGGVGYSVSFGQVGALSLVSTNYAQEAGYSNGLALCVQTASNNAGFLLRLNGATVASQAFVSAAQWGVNSTNRHFFEWDWHYQDGMTLRVDGQTVFANASSYGFIPQAGDRFAFAARTSATQTETLRLDNLLVATGGNLDSEPVNEPHVASAGSLDSQDAFDGNSSTFWADYSPPTGYVGGPIATQRNIAAYSVMPGGSDRTAHPRSWSLEGSTNAGAGYTVCATNGGYFRREGETLCMPSTLAKSFNLFRLNIATNNGNTAVTRVSEFVLHRFVPVAGPSDWQQADADAGLFWMDVAASADGNRLVACAAGDGIYLSVSNALHWTLVSGTASPSNYWEAVCSSASGSRLGAVRNAQGGASPDIFRSSNYGSSFTAAGAPYENWTAIASSDDGLKLAAVGRVFYGSPVYTSSNGGGSWTAGPVSRDWTDIASSSDGSRLAAVCYAATNPVVSGTLWLSTNSGASWQQTAAPSQLWTSVASSSDGMKLFACAENTNASSGAIFASTNGGTTWMQTPADAAPYSAIACSADGVVVAAVSYFGNGRIRVSQNSGANWNSLDAPAAFWRGIALSADGAQITIVGDSGIWTRTLQFRPPTIIDRPDFQYAYASQMDLYAYVNPNGLPTTAWFVFGTNLNAGARTNYLSVGSGTNQAGLVTTFSNLFNNTTYYYRTYATNRTGVLRYGSIISVDTPAASRAGINLAFNGTQLVCSATGSVLTTYYLQRATSLVPAVWANISTAHSGNFGQFQFNISPDDTNRFYRMVAP